MDTSRAAPPKPVKILNFAKFYVSTLCFFCECVLYCKGSSCRCRLAVWRQLPKLISAGPTPVTCSNPKGASCALFSFLRLWSFIVCADMSAAYPHVCMQGFRHAAAIFCSLWMTAAMRRRTICSAYILNICINIYPDFTASYLPIHYIYNFYTLI